MDTKADQAHINKVIEDGDSEEAEEAPVSAVIEDLIKPILVKKLLYRVRDRRIEEVVKDRHIIIHPKEKHNMTLIWVSAFVYKPYQPKILFLDENICKLPPGCRVVIITPTEESS